ncbi:hypothetical protein C8J56DRAFT_1065788 [Mycena floridula]|nr:hypothetical protein C8J56DRAFT_1065788 [Mycena floridula]
MLKIASFQRLLTHFRFLLTLRSDEGKYHSLILFRLSPDGPRPGGAAAQPGAIAQQLYAMEAQCPHLGADMSHADIEEVDSSLVAVCPWHRYDFDLKTGESETGLRACTYNVEVKQEDGTEHVFMEVPEGGTNWRLVELRPVSEEFADPPPPVVETGTSVPSFSGQPQEPGVVPESDPPKTLMEWAVLILNTPNPTLKVERTRHAVQLFRTGKLASIGNLSSKAPLPPAVPLREAQFLKNTVDPSKIKSRKNRAVMLHALANIEQWAIDLAWDIMVRFGPRHKDLPPAFFADFTKMALDESKHFSLLCSRLSALSPNTPYGSMPVHAALWESATVTSESFRSRLAIIHLVHEARGLDVNPGTIERFRKAGDTDSVKTMEIIHADEDGSDPVKTFREEVRKGWTGPIKGPFNVDDREKAGLGSEFYEDLHGELASGQVKPRTEESGAVPAVVIQYETI